MAFNDGTSVISEYAVKNSTLQASLDKAKNKFRELSYELGEQLSPLMTGFIAADGSMVKIISTVTGFLLKHGTAIVCQYRFPGLGNQDGHTVKEHGK